MISRRMALTHRLMNFFLATLTIVLITFSLGLYLAAQRYLYQQVSNNLETALNTLTAAMEITPKGVEWEPSQRKIEFGEGSIGGTIAWIVADPEGLIIAYSQGETTQKFAEKARHFINTPSWSSWINDNPRWSIASRLIEPDSNIDAANIDSQPDDKVYSSLTIAVAVPITEVQTTLQKLLGVLAGLSLFILVTSLLLGQWVCRKALAPLIHVSEIAKNMGETSFQERLPLTGANDELDYLVHSINGLLNRLAQSYDRQQRFTGDASHQLRTPLTAILGQIDVAIRRPRSQQEHEQVLKTVRDQAIHLRQIVESLLFLARSESEARLPGLESLNLCHWIEQFLIPWKEQAQGKELRLIDSSDESIWVLAQPVMLGELLGNILDNAIKYSLPGTSITVQILKTGSQCTISVIDSGPGISEKEIPHLFDPFYRSEETRGKGIAGVGLGLTIAHRLAMAMGLTITISSKLGKGSCVSVVFPQLLTV